MTLKCVPVEPVMGQWDDFCAIHKVPFAAFIQAYKAALSAAPPLPAEIEEAIKKAEGVLAYSARVAAEYPSYSDHQTTEEIIARALLLSHGRLP